jgi:DNA-binding NtrC family response regulator
MDTRPLLVLVVEDSRDVATMIQFALLRVGALPTVVSTGAEARLRLDASRYDILLTDFSLPDMTAATLVAAVGHLPQPPAIIVMSGHHTATMQAALADQPRITYLEKPFRLEGLYAALAAGQHAG